jgi:AraC-like DNA-binding protein
MPHRKSKLGWHMLSTDDVPIGKRWQYWRDAICDHFFQTACHAPLADSFSGKVSVRRLGSVTIGRVEADCNASQRDQSYVNRMTEARYALVACAKGHMGVRQNGENDALSPGDMVLVDLTKPSAGWNADGSVSTLLTFPQALLHQRIANTDLVIGKKLPGSIATCNLTQGFLTRLAAMGPDIDSRMLETLVNHSLDMIGMSIATVLGEQPSVSAYRAALGFRLRAYVKAHLHDPDLSAESLAAAFRLTSRQIHRLFAARGQTVGQYVREQRLDYCRRQLEDPAQRGRRIDEIARSAGFVSAAHFSRLFTQQFGQSPRDYRQVHQEAETQPATLAENLA